MLVLFSWKFCLLSILCRCGRLFFSVWWMLVCVLVKDVCILLLLRCRCMLIGFRLFGVILMCV